MQKLLYLLVLSLLQISTPALSQQISMMEKYEVKLSPAGRPHSLMYITNADQQAKGGTPEEKALNYIKGTWAKSGHQNSIGESLKHVKTRNMKSGDIVRYRQWFKGLKVGMCEFTVKINKRGKISSVVNTTIPIPPGFDTAPQITEAQALASVCGHFGIRPVSVKQHPVLAILPVGTEPKLVYSVKVATRRLGGWQAFVDAKNGELLMATRMSSGATGTGSVFDPNPTTSAKKQYGAPNFEDNGDNTNASLDNQRMEVELKDITFENGNYFLIGPYAQIVDVDAGFPEEEGLYEQTSDDFTNLTRADRAFEAVNCYYHLDKYLRYVNEDMGVNAMPNYPGGLRFDPHSNSVSDFYAAFDFLDPSNVQVHYSDGKEEGDVDTGEDAFIIVHEAGHAVHYWLTGGNYSNFEGVGEAIADYWGQSMTKGCDLTGVWEEWESEYHQTFHWGGMPSIEDFQRTTDYSPNNYAPHPQSQGNAPHIYSQHLSTALMRIYSDLGKEKTDRIVLEAMPLMVGSDGTPQNPNGERQIDAARYIYQAAIDMGYTNNELCIIYNHLNDVVKIGVYSPVTPPPTGGSLDVYMKDGTCDTGAEPNTVTQFMFHSPDIWVRHEQDGKLEHQNPEYKTSGNNYVYVRIRSRGCVNTGDVQLRLYWSKASTGLAWPIAWTTANVPGPNGMVPAGREITASGPETISLGSAVEAGGELIVSIPWQVSNPADYYSGNHHFCLLARLEAVNDPISFLETSGTSGNARNNNNITAKNVSIYDNDPNNAVQGPISVFVGCESGLTDSRVVVESARHPLGKTIFDYGKVYLELMGNLATEWAGKGYPGSSY